MLILLLGVAPGFAQANAPEITAEGVQYNLNVVWTLAAAILVFIMQAGFMLLELGFSRAKNTINVIMKNFLDCSVGTLAFFFVGFGLMFGSSLQLGGFGLFGMDHFGLFGFTEGDLNNEPVDSDIWRIWMFQVVFATTAVTIVSGAMAERTRFHAYLIGSFVVCAFIYPVVGHWCWSDGGWLGNLYAFHDFAGSTVVHATGGACALAGIIVVGARSGRYGKDGKPRLIVGHNIPMAALGTFILWFAWFGFNAGSTTEGTVLIGIIAVNTHIAAAAGAMAATLTCWMMMGRPDITASLNGALAGLVAITAGCDVASPAYALLVGGVGGVVCFLGTVLLEKLRLDDVVGAVPVHLFAGVWGTIAVAFAPHLDRESGTTVTWQILGTLSCVAFVFVLSLLMFFLLRLTMGLRMGDDEQKEGLDFHEHSATAYPDFVTSEQSL